MKIKIIFITGLITTILFFVPSFVYSIEIAGSSAQLDYIASNTNSQFIADVQHDADNLKNLKYKRAIKAVLNRYNSPMTDSVDSFINACNKYNLDCFLLPAIAGLESRFGQLIAPETCNPFGWGRGYIKFESWDSSIMAVAKGLRENYYDKGAHTIEDVGYVYAEKSTTWPIRVRSFINEFQKEFDQIDLISSIQ